ncbi:hypothetical protein COF76_23045 [Bacillus wiedmannii]|nr:DUF6364 family protein [Bacillus wiedmannii]PHE94689.1 hypothetical protein COF76_23045 [Bacillus wiedmannii]
MARKKFTTTLDEELIVKIKVDAARRGTDVSKIIENLIKEYLEKEPSN